MQALLTAIFLLLLLLPLLVANSQKPLTLPITHSESSAQEAQQVKAKHNTSYVIFHNSRNHQQGHLRHQMHLLRATNPNTYALNSMGYFFTLPLIIEGYHYDLNIDTGSSDIFIKGAGTKGNPKYKFNCSTCVGINQKFTLSYIDGTLQAYQINLGVNMGIHNFREHILVAYTAPHNFWKAQGVVGLSYPSLAISPYPNFIQTLINLNIIPRYAFGLSLNFQNHNSSYITFGVPDPSLFYGVLNKVKLSGGTAYMIALDTVSFGSGPDLAMFRAILDSGNTCITVPSVFQPIIESLFNTSGINACAFNKEPFAPSFKLLRCKITNFTILPTVNIVINRVTYTVDMNAYFQRCVQSGNVSFCDTYLESINFGNDVFLGDGFFIQYYTFFDLQNQQIGIAKNRNNLSYHNMYQPYSVLSASDIKFYNSL